MNLFIDAEWADEPVSLNLSVYDEGDDETVYCAVFDGEHVIYFEASNETPFWGVIKIAIEYLNEELECLR